MTREEAKAAKEAGEGHFISHGKSFRLWPGSKLASKYFPRKADANNWNRSLECSDKIPSYFTINEQAGTCEICGFNRVIENAHIVPDRFGGPYESINLLKLCPNHHTLFDRNLLTHEEIEKIWPRIFESVRFQSRLTDPVLSDWRNGIYDRYGLSFDLS